MQLPTPISQQYPTLISDIQQGEVKIPQFQRDFVWTVSQTARLLDSIIKGYPIGAFIFWETKERLRVVRNLGGADLPMPPDGDIIKYVLDGQQRLTSIYACITGAEIDGAKYSDIFVDLAASDEDDEVVVLENKPSCIRVKDVADGDFNLLAQYDAKYPGKLKQYQDNLRNYPFSIIQYRDADISIATDIFSRINMGGKSLTTFEIMVAKTYDVDRNFDLLEEMDNLTGELVGVDYETIAPETLLQTVSVILRGDCRKQTILGLPKAEFIDGWGRTVVAVKDVIDFFQTEYHIPVSHLLPYSAMLVPFAYFSYKKNGKISSINAAQRKYLCDFFWRCALSERYSFALESKLGQDIKKMDDILGSKLPQYEEVLPLDEDWLMNNGYFRAGRSFVKAILCLYASAEPQSFDGGAKVKLGNNYLLRANSKNYHHFFPKAHLKKQGSHDEDMINHVLNITMVKESLNKGAIGAKRPSVYMKKFRDANPDMDMAAVMRTHLIDDLDEFGVWTDDYDKFLAKRAERVIAEIKKRIILPTKD